VYHGDEEAEVAVEHQAKRIREEDQQSWAALHLTGQHLGQDLLWQ
jgi:hypothetical protein